MRVNTLEYDCLKPEVYGIFRDDNIIIGLTRVRMPADKGLPYLNFQTLGGPLSLDQFKTKYEGCELVPVKDITYVCEI